MPSVNERMMSGKGQVETCVEPGVDSASWSQAAQKAVRKSVLEQSEAESQQALRKL